MTRYSVFFAIIAFFPLLSYSTTTEDVVKEANRAMMDLYYSPTDSYETRIRSCANEFLHLLYAIEESGDEGDAESMELAYKTFLDLLIKAERTNELDYWNRHFATNLSSKNPVAFYCVLCMASAYTLCEVYDNKQVVRSLTSKEFQGDGQLGLAFLTDYKRLYSSSSLFDQARVEAIKAQMLLLSNQVDNSIIAFSNATQMMVQARGKDSQEYIQFKMFEEIPYIYCEDYNSAKEKALSALTSLNQYQVSYHNLGKTVRGDSFKDYSSLLARLSVYNQKLNHDIESIENADRALNSAYENYGASSFQLMGPLSNYGMPYNGPNMYLEFSLFDIKQNYADLLFKSQRFEDSKEIFKELLRDYKIEVNNTSKYSTLDVKSMQQSVAPLISLAPLCVNRFPGDSEIEELAYNCALQYKNFSLMTENLLQKLIRLENDDETTNIYKQILLLKQKLDSPESKDYTLINDSIRLLNEQLLLNLDFQTYGEILNVDWHTIQNHLPTNSIAIEFIIADEGENCVYYANLLTESESPKCIRLCTEKELLSILTPYTSVIAYNLIWDPIKNYLTGRKNIYFSPTGILHKIAIEYFTDGNTLINQKYNLYRLSSTRELAYGHKSHANMNHIVIYGGINYDSQVNSSMKSMLRITEDTDKSIEGLPYLPQTHVEMAEIASIFSKTAQVDTISGNLATEGSFKNLSGEIIDIIHIATHGYYVPKFKRSNITKVTINPFNSFEDQSLSRSGLLFAGANNAIRYQRTDGDDGILTAKEISQMDLNGTKLVTLSACETALGDISGEGVFGLQRGLKKAGASALLMSLWRVDDMATKILMTSVYQSLSQGQTIYKAFTDAQHYLMNFDNGKYQDSKYWAAFILIDAI